MNYQEASELPAGRDINGTPFYTGSLVRKVETGELFLVRGMYVQDEGASLCSTADRVELVQQRPDDMDEVVKLINESRERGLQNHGRIRTDLNGRRKISNRTIVWGW